MGRGLALGSVTVEVINMETNFLPVIYPAVRKFEGGNDDDPRDPGGRTSRGIIQSEWNIFRKSHPGRPADVWQASEADIGAIYHDGEYWRGQGLGLFFSGGDETLFDYGVNSGVGRSQKVLRRCLHMADNAPRADVLDRVDKLSLDQRKALIKAVNDERLAFLRGLKTFATFGRGWTARVATCLSISMHLADHPVAESAAPPVPQVPADMPKEASARGNHAEPEAARKAIKTGAVAGGGGPLLWIQTHPWEAGLTAGVAVVALGAGLYFLNRWHKARTEAAPVGWTPPAALAPT